MPEPQNKLQVRLQDDLRLANNALGSKLHRSLGQSCSGNFVFSPFSVYCALEMLRGGAQGDTLREIRQICSTYKPATKDVINDITSDQLDIANSAWFEQTLGVSSSYRDFLRTQTQAEIRDVPFFNDPAGATQQVNAWIEAKTRGHVPAMIPAKDWHFILVNTIYLLAKWESKFNDALTEDQEFYALDGDLMVPTMHQTVYAAATAGPIAVVVLPYENGRLRLNIFMPTEYAELSLLELEESLTPARAATLMEACSPTTIDLYLPRFRMDSTFDLSGPLQALGIQKAFQPGVADFSNINNGAASLWVEMIRQDAGIKVDEQGTEAYAATAIFASGYCAGPIPKPLPIHIDRPFLFMITDTATGIVLFSGRVTDPQE